MRAWGLLMVIGGVGIMALACGGGSDAGERPVDEGFAQSGSDTAMGPGISVMDARVSKLESPVLVNGFLVITNEDVELCESLPKSVPPGCAGGRLAVTGLDPTVVGPLQVVGYVRWSAAPIQLLGSIDGDTLIIDPLRRS